MKKKYHDDDNISNNNKEGRITMAIETITSITIMITITTTMKQSR